MKTAKPKSRRHKRRKKKRQRLAPMFVDMVAIKKARAAEAARNLEQLSDQIDQVKQQLAGDRAVGAAAYEGPESRRGTQEEAPADVAGHGRPLTRPRRPKRHASAGSDADSRSSGSSSEYQ